MICRRFGILVVLGLGLLLLAACARPAEAADTAPAVGSAAQVAAAETAGTATTSASAAVAKWKAEAGPHKVLVLVEDWKDTGRSRTVPVKIYYPADVPAEHPAPVVIFSHGLGGTREGYEYLGRHWASWGYVSVHLQHVGSDDSVWKDVAPTKRMAAMRESIRRPMAAVDRPRDVSFALDRLTELNRSAAARSESSDTSDTAAGTDTTATSVAAAAPSSTPADFPLRGRMDMGRVAMAGHSYGAWTTLVIAGEKMVTPRGMEFSLADARIRAAIPMSTPCPSDHSTLDKAFGSIRIPCLHMTGTLDDSPINDSKAADRRLPYDHTPGPNQYLVTFAGGDHMVFSGRPRSGALGRDVNDAMFQDLILQSSTAFLDAYVCDDPAARRWLAEGGFEKLLADRGVFEQKRK